ncbi:MAG: TROVE domain-containing protein [Armatimonadetes bacterium]|nr:TROVE domain-containing protein [Armatimonadota bacterium]
MQKIHEHFSTKRTPQSEPMVGATTPQVQMRSGGHGWEVDDWKRLERFLILGTEGGTYYVGEHKLTVEACRATQRCIQADGPKVVATVAAVSHDGRAPSNDPALFVLAMCAKLGNETTRAAAYQALPMVARIGTHLFHFAEYCKALGGIGGNGFKRAIARWYTDKPAERVAYQAVKYQQRNGWSHRDLLRLSHPKASSVDHQAIFRWITQGELGENESTENVAIVEAFEEIKRCESTAEVVRLIKGYGLPREAVPTKFLNDVAIWEALLPKMPVFALMRNLNKLTALGMVTNTSATTAHIASVLGSEERLVKARVHPLAVLIALKTYAAGRGFKGKLTWQPCARVIDVLDAAFYAAFKAVRPTGKRLCLGLDVSGSMGAKVAGQPFLSCREAAAAMAMVTARVESTYEILGFTSGGPGYVQMTSRACFGWSSGGSGVSQLPISPRQRLDDVVRMTYGLPFGGTDCALPILWALNNGVEIDAFVTYTDNESWAGDIHVDQALRMYRDKTGIPAKLVAVAMTADRYSVANPDDAGQLDVVGFDTATPNVISDFVTS